MELQKEQQQPPKKRPMNNNAWTGVLFLVIGGILLSRQLGSPLPKWLFGWETLLIAVGIFILVRNKLRDLTGMILIAIGLIFLSDDIFPGIRLQQYAIPIIIMALGLLFILKPKGMCSHGHPRRHGGGSYPPGGVSSVEHQAETVSDAAIDIVSIFGGIKRNILSKQFRGGEIVCVFGGSEINLTNADFASPVELDTVLIFGGTKLIVPANWEIRSEIATIFAGVHDKRPQPANLSPGKTLILKGTIIFAGIEIVSF